MAYLHIDNLYKEKSILMLKECYAMEKIDGTSAHLRWADGKLTFFSGGVKYEQFCKLFNADDLTARFKNLNYPKVVIYGEAYGGKVQGRKDIYGPNLKFVVFEVRVDKSWLSVPNAEDMAVNIFGLDFVPYESIPCTVEAIEVEKMKDSTQAVRNGIGSGKMREGVVLRPLVELTMNNGQRLIAKHKREEFKETKKPRPLGEKLVVLEAAEAIAGEWVTPMRFVHIMDKLPKDLSIKDTRLVINAMLEDIQREAAGEIVYSQDTRKAIGKATVKLFYERIKTLNSGDRVKKVGFKELSKEQQKANMEDNLIMLE